MAAIPKRKKYDLQQDPYPAKQRADLGIHVTSFLVFYTKVTVNIGLKRHPEWFIYLL